MVPQQLLRRSHHLCPWEPLPLSMAETGTPAEQPEEPASAREVAAVSADAGLVQMQVHKALLRFIITKWLGCTHNKKQKRLH